MTTRRQLQMLQQVHCTFLKSLLISWTTQCVLKVFVHFSASQANPKPQRQRSQYCNLLKRPLRILQNILKKSEQMCNETMISNNTRRQNLRISVIPATSIATVMQVIPFLKACLTKQSYSMEAFMQINYKNNVVKMKMTIKLAWVFNIKKNPITICLHTSIFHQPPTIWLRGSENISDHKLLLYLFSLQLFIKFSLRLI